MSWRAPGAPVTAAVVAIWVVVGPVAAQPPGRNEMADLDDESRKRGFAVGLTGEFFRYKHLFYKQPSDEDRNEAVDIAAYLRCDVCAAVVGSLVAQAKSFSEDDLADVLEGNTDYEPTGDEVTDRMLSHKKGCNKHFKDELVAHGYVVRQCKDVVPGRNDSNPCLHKTEGKPSASSVDTYELWKEGLFHACEQTVARNGDTIAARLAEVLREEAAPGDRAAAVRAACEVEARCAGRARARAERDPEPHKASGRKAGRKARRRARRRRGGPEL